MKIRLVLLLIKIVVLPLSLTKKQLLTIILIQRKELSLCKRKLDSLHKRVSFTQKDRIFYTLLLRISDKIRSFCSLVKPETLLSWSKEVIKRHWRYPKKKPGRPPVRSYIKQVICSMKNSNPSWGYKRIRDELAKLGISLDKKTIVKIIATLRRNGKIKKGITWRKFITSHIKSLFCMDFITIDTILGKRFYLFFIMHIYTRKIIHFRLTASPSLNFTRQSLYDFSYERDRETTYLIHDNDPCFASIDYEGLGIRSVKTTVYSPNMNSYAERFVRSIRHEALDNFILLHAGQIKKIAGEYIDYYNYYRPHQGINAVPCGYKPQEEGKIMKIPILSGLHHHYYRKAC